MSNTFIWELLQKQPYEIRRMLDSVVQNADETTEMFADRVLQMTKLAYPSVAEEQQQFMAIDRFVMGLRPSCIHMFEITK